MKKSRILIGLLLLVSCLLVGCEDFSDLLIEVEEIVFDNFEKDTTKSKYQEKENADQDDFKIDVIEEEIIDWEEEEETEIGQPQVILETDEVGYAYQLISEELKPLYHEILKVLEDQLEKIEINTISIEDMDYIFRCVLNDHPELFYVEGYVYTKHTRQEEIRRIEFSGNYTMDKEESVVVQNEIDKVVNNFLLGISVADDEYTKVKYVYDYLINQTQYNLEAKDNQNIISVFLNGQSVCQGYAKAMQYLLTELEMESTLIIGTVTSGERHAWNLVRVNDAYYYVDSTWGDASYVFDTVDAETKISNNTINYDYLCVTTEQLLKTHQINNVVPVPECIESKDNYYVKENSYFDEIDTIKMETLFERAFEGEEESVTLKCASQTTFQEILRIMIEEQDIFRYLEDGNTEVSYTYNEQQLTISFWL